MPAPEGPHLAVAVICERVLVEKDDVMSLIRIFDQFNLPAFDEKVLPQVAGFWLAVSFRAGKFRGSAPVSIKSWSPSGDILWEQKAKLNFPTEKGDEQASNLLANLNIPATQEGTYWFEVAFEDKIVTRVPLRLVRQPVKIPSEEAH
jgi:hypothetical protein